jgi:hypothetical protein
MNSLEDVLNEWHANLLFQEAFKKNPEKALQDFDLTLAPHDINKIKTMLKIQDEELEKRINK